MSSGIKSSNADLIINADGVGSEVVFQQNGTEVGRIGSGGVGKVLQVVQVHIDTTSTQAVSTNTVTEITNMVASITPTSATSKIKVEVRWAGEVNSGHDCLFGIKRDETEIGSSPQVGSRNFGIAPLSISYHVNDDSTPENCVYSYIDSPSSTANIEYKATIRHSAATTVYNNRTIGDFDNVSAERMTSTITLTEIGA